MALHILNCSIDAPDKLPDYIPENLNVNDIESISELVLEQFLGLENAVEEHDEPDSTDGLSFEIAKIVLYYQPIFSFLIPQKVIFFYDELSELAYIQAHITIIHPEIISPPPKVA